MVDELLGSIKEGDTPRAPNTAEQQNIEFERYKARLDFWKFVLGSVVAAIAIALIPPLFQWGTAFLEKSKGETYLRNEVIRQFVTNALDKDLENRIRLAHYFSNVADQPFKEGWSKYYSQLISRRAELRTEINRLEMQRALKFKPNEPLSPEILEIDRTEIWLRGELGDLGSAGPVNAK